MNGDVPRFLGPALETVSRVLGLCDRAAGSPTAGCCDRAHWHYRSIDFPNARLQEAGWLFALAYAAPLPGNRFRGQQRLLDWSRQVWRFWLAQRNRDGSVAEAYPNERSFCGTSFSAACFAETVELLGGAARWPDEVADAERTFAWLAAHASPEVGNQMAASLLALTLYARLSGKPEFAAAAHRRRGEMLACAGADGTVREYGGFDAGYQSITMSLLARVQRLGDDPELARMLDGSEALMRTAVDDLGRTDVGRNCRRTQFLYPYGFASKNSPVTARIMAGLQADAILRPTWMDDRYCIGMAADYLLTAWEASRANDAR
jgi:hypothetical protein